MAAYAEEGIDLKVFREVRASRIKHKRTAWPTREVLKSAQVPLCQRGHNLLTFAKVKTNDMKNILAAAFLLISVYTFGQAPVKDYFNVPHIKFNKETYNLAWTSHPTDIYYKHEYLLPGDTFPKFKTMLLLEMITGIKLKDVIGTKVAELKKLKETNPVVNYEILDNSKLGEYMLDFLISENSADGKYVLMVERNVYRYKTFKDKDGNKGVILFGISMRHYGDEGDKFFATLKATRDEMLNMVGTFDIPGISIP